VLNVSASDSAFMNANISTWPVWTSWVMQGIRPSEPNFGCSVVPSSISWLVVRAGNAVALMRRTKKADLRRQASAPSRLLDFGCAFADYRWLRRPAERSAGALAAHRTKSSALLALDVGVVSKDYRRSDPRHPFTAQVLP
jgi:hypothetical protein